ncbi:hypothetical protein Taro_011171, partial [Colocasia esculenta]|nr:hypothetical protein [Colocasia esculenta]
GQEALIWGGSFILVLFRWSGPAGLLSSPSAGELACDFLLLFFFFVRRVEDEGIHPLADGGIDTILHEKFFSISSSFSMVISSSL